jgi:hypothetical protein
MLRSLVRTCLLATLLSGCVRGSTASPAPVAPQRDPGAPLAAGAAAQPGRICLDCAGWGTPITPQPVFVIDGLLYRIPSGHTSPIRGLDPRDVVDIEILKAPAAIALYGEAGRDGVVVVRTKHPPVPVAAPARKP